MMLRRLLPRRLFARALLILVMPVVLLQVVVAYFFFERHWQTVSEEMARSVAGEISYITAQIEAAPTAAERDAILTGAAGALRLGATLAPGRPLPINLPAPSFGRNAEVAQRLRKNLDYRLDRPFAIDTEARERDIVIYVQTDQGLLAANVRRKRLFSSTTYVFILSMVGASLIFLAIAISFLRNQIRPIRKLAEAAERFGKGREVGVFRPSGAADVRQAAQAFLDMRDRIQRQITQRTEMLAGVSHDLRAPITRMKLQLAMWSDSREVGELRSDVDEMERMVDGYLAFASGQEGEEVEPTDLSHILAEITADARRQGAVIELSVAVGLVVPLRPTAFRRGITNLIENARRHGTRIAVTAARQDDQIVVHVDDDGPGIPEVHRQDVFRPFHRLDASRKPGSGSSGLGLSIARDMMRGHGGDITLDEAPLGGLRATLRLPL